MQVFLGIDGGGSKTALVLADGTGRVLGCSRGEGTAMVGAPSAAVVATLGRLVGEACRAAGVRARDITRGGAGMNGVDFRDEHAVQVREVAEALGMPAARLSLVNDGITALWGAVASRAGAVVQHGSGFTAAWRRDHGAETLFDHLDVGGTYDMRAALMQTVARMIDGRRPATPLKEQVLHAFGLRDEEAYADAVFRGEIPVEVRRGTPPLIYRAWLAGDAAASEIVLCAAEDYAAAASAMLDKIGEASACVALGGGVIRQAPDAFRELVARRIRDDHPAAMVGVPLLPPEYGGVLMAAHREGGDVPALFARLVEGLVQSGGEAS